MDDKACAILNGANSSMMARITGKSVKEEASRATRTFDIVRWIRARRLQWVGHIIRQELTRRQDNPGDQPRLIYKAIVHMYQHREQGDLLHDIPAHDNWDGLCEQASNRKRWRQLVAALKQDQCTQKSPRLRIEISDKVPGWAPQRCFKHATTIFDKVKGKNDNDLTNTPRSRAAKLFY